MLIAKMNTINHSSAFMTQCYIRRVKKNPALLSPTEAGVRG